MSICTQQAFKQVSALRTRFPWAVANSNQIIVGVFNYRDEAKSFAKNDPSNLVAFDASGVMFTVEQLEAA